MASARFAAGYKLYLYVRSMQTTQLHFILNDLNGSLCPGNTLTKRTVSVAHVPSVSSSRLNDYIKNIYVTCRNGSGVQEYHDANFYHKFSIYPSSCSFYVNKICNKHRLIIMSSLKCWRKCKNLVKRMCHLIFRSILQIPRSHNVVQKSFRMLFGCNIN